MTINRHILCLLLCITVLSCSFTSAKTRGGPSPRTAQVTSHSDFVTTPSLTEYTTIDGTAVTLDVPHGGATVILNASIAISAFSGFDHVVIGVKVDGADDSDPLLYGIDSATFRNVYPFEWRGNVSPGTHTFQLEVKAGEDTAEAPVTFGERRVVVAAI